MDNISISNFEPDSFEGMEREFTNITVERRTSCNVLARARRYGRWWLLKGLLPELRNDAFYQAMLRKELDLMMRAQHPGIVQASSLEEVEGLGPCIVMEFIDGWTLKEWLETTSTMDDRRKVAEELVDVTSYLHRLGIVHRDLKPSNIMITRNGLNVKLIDFGLADSDTYAVLKQSAGTPRYMAPEQANGDKPDVRNDIYSLGVIFTDMNLGEDFKAVVRRCQEPIDRRYHTMDELHSALDDAIKNARNNQKWWHFSKNVWVALLIVALIALAVGVAWWRNYPKNLVPEDMTYKISNPHCESDSLDAWTFELGGRTLSSSGTLMYYMKDFDVYQVVRGLPAGEYELIVKAWGENNKVDMLYSNAEIYAGPFSQLVKNKAEDSENNDNVLHFVLLDDSLRIGFRSFYNSGRFSRAVADDFRLYLIRPLTFESQRREWEVLVDSARKHDDERRFEAFKPQKQVVNGQSRLKLTGKPEGGLVYNLWRGHEDSLPAGWITEQRQECCRIVNKEDVGRSMGDSDIYIEYLSEEPAQPGLIIGKRVYLTPGAYLFGANFFAQNAERQPTKAFFAVKGFDNASPAFMFMNFEKISFDVAEEQEVTVGLWAAPGSDVCRAGICDLILYKVLEEE